MYVTRPLSTGGIVQTARIGRRDLDGPRLAVTALLVEPDLFVTRTVLVADLPSKILSGDGFESASLP